MLEKTALIKASSDLYTAHFSLLADRLQNTDRAYHIVEEVRGRITTDLLLAGSIASPEARKEQRTLSELRLKLISAQSAPETRKLRDQIFLVEQAAWVVPEISILKAASSRTIPLREVEHDLDPSAAILEYVVAEPKSYCLVISRAGTRIFPLAGQHEIQVLAMAYLQAVKAKQSARKAARHLYAALLAPIREVTNKSHLVIVRDGVLHLLPFDAFVDPTGRYLVEAHTVVYSPSATAFFLLGAQTRRKPHRTHGLLAIGGVPYDRGELKLVATTRGYDGSALSDLPASSDEVLAANQAVHEAGNTVLLGKKATEPAFKRSALADYRILHLAVHGFASPIDSEQAALVLLSDPAAGEDGLLYAAEIVQLKLNADLAILSACDTAVGPVQGEEGIETLSRAFLLAGAKDVISTLWPVDDTFSLFLMKQFYQHLAAGQPAASALVSAKRDMLHKYRAAATPYYWAGYTIEGAFDSATVHVESHERLNVPEQKRAN